MNSKADKKLVIVSYQQKDISVILHDNRLYSLKVYAENDASILGNIYFGKVQNIAQNIQAAFVEVGDKKLCFLPLSDAKHAYVRNRKTDGSLRCGDEILVQVEKDAVKTKQPVVTTKISLSGKYLVLSMGSSRTGFSKKLAKEKKEAFLEYLISRGILTEDGNCTLAGCGIVVRTNAENLSVEEFGQLEEEYQSLWQCFQTILGRAEHSACFTQLSEKKVPAAEDVKNYYEKDYDEIITDIPRVYEALTVGTNLPMKKPVRLYEDEYSLLKLYSLKTKINELLGKNIWLKSGAYLVIEPTEALTVIDVNTGKFVKKASDTDETFFQVNAEAAKECARQLRLRNISGMVMIDFINMKSAEKREALLQLLRAETIKDEVQTDVIDYTALGLVEVTRKRIGRPLREVLRKEE